MEHEYFSYDRNVREDIFSRATDPSQTKSQEESLRLLRLINPTRQKEATLSDLKVKFGLRQLIGESPAFLAAVGKLPTMARSNATVLISGETGTGKEVCARAIHYLSARSTQPFIVVNCGAIPTELVENELFGHERGAYTDARDGRLGLIAEAEGGTVFLDEIDALPLLAQVKLLRLLQEKEYRPLGSLKTRTASVRMICATNVDLAQAVQSCAFRRDLYYRINILPMILPPLRDRLEDIALLAQHFLEKFAVELKKPVTDFSPDVLHMLREYSWPGNVRELEHTIERAVALTDSTILTATDISLPEFHPPASHEPFQIAKERAVALFEKNYLTEILLAHGGNISQAAQAAGKNRRAFWQLLRKHGIDGQRLRTAHRPARTNIDAD